MGNLDEISEKEPGSPEEAPDKKVKINLKDLTIEEF